jgi:hypothetical protein
MKELRFRLPANLPSAARSGLQHAYLTYGAESYPIPSRAEVTEGELVLRTAERIAPFSACIPWSAMGEVWMLSTTTLLPSPQPYDLLRELARGQLYRIREAIEDWSEVEPELMAELRTRLRQGVSELLLSAEPHSEASQALAEHALMTALELSREWTLKVSQRLTPIRQQRRPVPFYLCWSARTPPAKEYEQLCESFQGVRIPIPFNPSLLESEDFWRQQERLIAWWQQQGWPVCVGPLFDFASDSFHKHWWSDNPAHGTVLEQAIWFLTRAVHRWGEAVQDWYIVASANFLPSARSLEDGLAVLEQLLRPVRRLLAGKRVRLGLAQPWGERAARFPEQPIPLLLADWIARADTGITTIDLEVIFGCEPRGTWLRPPLSVQLLLERFAEVPLELEISFGLPAATQTDPLADPPDQNVIEPASESWQAAWAGTLLDLGLAQPKVQRITWLDASDTAPHLVPHGGLFDAHGQPRPVLAEFRRRRAGMNPSKVPA